ncbi:MAG TPA: amidohydrolase family protein [Candidatus Limnocylindrales bacterium]|nr:amidohydrolase family protein [Candidatus Limnocylindrales bacterium]
MFDLVIRGGDVVTPQGVGKWDVAVQGERIVSIGLPDPRAEAGRIIDATGKVVVPGGIEPHTHLAHFGSMHPEENLHTLGPEEDTRGMVFGGTTTHVDFCFVRPGLDIAAAIESRAARWTGNSYADYSFHVALQGQLPIKLFDQMPDAIAAGFPSFKVFTVEVLPPHPKRHPYRLDFGRIKLAMEQVAKHGGIMAVHAEDHDLVQFMYEKFREEKQTDGWLLPDVHSKLSELLAFHRTIQLAAHTGAGVYFVHTSAREGVEAVAAARARGLPIYAETLHHYACFNAEDYRTPRGFCYHTYPSLKFPDDQAALWDGIVRDGISTMATDEFPTSLELKLRGQDLENVTGGNLGAEARVGITWSEGVVKRGMSLPRFAEVTATNAARILGLYPKKGVLAPGSDADIVLIDPAIAKTLRREDFHVSDYSPWEGWTVRGWPVTTILRGKVVVENGRLLGSTSDGKLVPRKVSPEVLRRPAC